MKRIIQTLALVTLAGLASQAPAAFVEVTGTISGNDTRWTRNNVYILREIIYVVPPAKLTIEPGTIIRGVAESNDTNNIDTDANLSPGALFICRGAKLIANGTPDDPIVFTSIDDTNVVGGAATVPTTVNGTNVAATYGVRSYAPDGFGNATAGSGSNGFAYDKLWGGIVILGEAPIGYDGDNNDRDESYDAGNNTFTFTGNGSNTGVAYPTTFANGLNDPANDIKGGNGAGVALIEGTPFVSISNITYTEPFPGAANKPSSGNILGGAYGGLNRADNSGIIRFVECRYAGFELDLNSELNGITWGGVGSGTVNEWLSVFNSADDNFEWFGGFNSARFLISMFPDDDGFDGDTGYNGNIQFAFAIQDNYSYSRSGYLSNNTQVGRATPNDGGGFSDNAAEWDGSERRVQNGSMLPNTNPHMYNFSIIGTTGGGGKDGVRTRRGVASQWRNSVIQDVVDRGFNSLTESNATASADYIVYHNTANAAGNVTAGNSINATATQVAGNGHLTKNGLDIRLVGGVAASLVTSFNIPANRTDTYPFSGWTKAPFAGAARDNNFLAEWTIAEWLELTPTTNIARPAVALGVSGSNPTISFASATGAGGRSVLYSIERSTDRRVYTPFAVVSDNDGAGTTDKAGTTFATADGNGTGGSITVTDMATTLISGTPVYYRVIPL